MASLAHICLLVVGSAPGLLRKSAQYSDCQVGRESSRLGLFALGTVKICLMKITNGFQNVSQDRMLGNSRHVKFSFTSLNWNGFASSSAGDLKSYRPVFLPSPSSHQLFSSQSCQSLQLKGEYTFTTALLAYGCHHGEFCSVFSWVSADSTSRTYSKHRLCSASQYMYPSQHKSPDLNNLVGIVQS